MIWHYFPIGFRFPVRDFSEETKRACWEVALSALLAGDPAGITLYDAQETFDAGSGGPVYQCIACCYGIKQSRATAKMLMSLDRLMTRLCSHTPFMQANALESFGPYTELGRIGEDRTVCASEAGKPLLFGLNPVPMPQNDGIRMLIVSDGPDAEANTRALGTAAAEQRLRVRRMQISDGGSGFVRALVTERKGRYETVTVTDGNGERHTETIGILPQFIAVLDTAGKDAETVEKLMQKTRELGYRDIRTGMADDAKNDPAAQAERVFEMIGNEFETAAKQADFVLLHAHGNTAQAALGELNALLKPTCLLARSDADTHRMMQEFPVLRSVIAVNGPDADLKAVFGREVLPQIGKDVAKTERI